MLLVKLAIRPWKKNFTSQFFSVLTLSVFFLISALIVVSDFSFSRKMAALSRYSMLTVFVRNDLPEAEISDLTDHIQMNLGAHPNEVIEREVVSAKTVGETLSNQFPELLEQFGKNGDDLKTVFPKAIHFYGQFKEGAADSLAKRKEIESVDSSEMKLAQLKESVLSLRLVLKAILAAVGVGIFVLFFFIQKQSALAQADVSSQLHELGASQFEARVISSLHLVSVGLAAALLSIVFWLGLSPSFFRAFQVFAKIPGSLSTPNYPVVLAFIAAGGFLGAFFSLISKPILHSRG